MPDQSRSVHKLLALLVCRQNLSLAEACRDLHAAYLLAQRPELAHEVERVQAVLVDGVVPKTGGAPSAA